MQNKKKTVGETTSELTNNSVKFEVGKTYDYLGSPTIKVLERTEKTITVFNYREFKQQRKRVFVNLYDEEYIVLNDTGDSISAANVYDNSDCENIIKSAVDSCAIVNDGDGLITCIVDFGYEPDMNFAITNMDDYKHIFEERGYTVTRFYDIDDLKWALGFELQPITEEEQPKEWYEGYYDEWIFCYNAFLKLLLMTYGDGDYTNIRERLDTSADKVVHNIELDEIKDAVVALAEKDADYGMVNIDWSNKEAVKLFIND